MKNLIAISGKMGSGKDTVGVIIQALTGIGFGNDKTFELFKEMGIIPISLNKSPFVVKKFAGKLKDIVCLILGCTREDLEAGDFKSTPMNSDWDESHGIDTPRDLLQVLGTNCGRDMIHPNIWVNALFADYKCLDDTKRTSFGNVLDYSDCPFPAWIITDLRFPNEFESIKKRNGITIRVTTDRVGEASGHESETALDDHDFDYVIDNSGTYEDLIDKVSEILRKENLII